MFVYMKIDLHLEGTFMRYPVISYSDGMDQRIEDVDFDGMDMNEFVVFLERFANERCVNVYFWKPGIEFPNGLRILASEIDYHEFIKVRYVAGYVLDVYMDHFGVNVHEWIIDEQVYVNGVEGNHFGVTKVNEEVHVEGVVQNDLN